MFDQMEFVQRRRKLMTQMGETSIAILFAAPESIRSADGYYSYRQDSNFFYLTGLKEPDSVAVLIGNPNNEGEFILFNRPRNPKEEQWTGKRIGQEGATSLLQADKSYPIEELSARLPELLGGKNRLYYTLGKQSQQDEIVLNALGQVNKKVRSGVNAPNEIINLDKLISELRLLKSPAEIDTMRHAASVSAKAHVRAMQMCQPGMYEYQLQAQLAYEFLMGGCQEYAYTPIVGAGENACTLHYIDNNQQIQDGDLVLIDAGGEYDCYSADITRTFPANGKFSPTQRALYEVVLNAQLAVINMIRPGIRWNDMHTTAVRCLTEGLISLGILQGELDTLIENKAYQPFYMHNTGHWLGLDTHDVGEYKIEGQWRILAPGMVLTVEPGLYINPNMPDVDPKWWGMGIRIEDDVLVTPNGCEVLSHEVPKTIDDIEKLQKIHE